MYESATCTDYDRIQQQVQSLFATHTVMQSTTCNEMLMSKLWTGCRRIHAIPGPGFSMVGV